MPTDESKAREKIDSQLENSGWSETTDSENGTGYYTEYPTESGPVDYALLIDGVPISVVEAKKPSTVVKSIFGQAERYARSLPSDTGYAYDLEGTEYAFPIAFGANGNKIKLFDFRLQSPQSREIQRFPSKEDLKKRASIDYNKAFSQIDNGLINSIDPKLWLHQNEAANEVFDCWSDREQKSLTHLATGTGKTRMAMAITWAFLEARLGDKVLFIPNQRPLANDAHTEFQNYNPEGRKLRMGERFRVTNLMDDDYAFEHADIVVTTLQKLWTLSKEDNPFSLAEFDLIISDESHQSIYNEKDGYGYSINQLDAYHLGLTATPTTRTIDWFDNNNVYQYSYQEGVEDKILVPFNTHTVETELTMNGLERNGKTYKSQDIGKKLLIPDNNRIMGEQVRNYIENEENENIDEQQILIFACNDRHAIELVEDLRQEVFPDKPATFVQRATYSADRPHETINDFGQKYKNPRVLVTVQMVEEGVDIPELEHIVLMKPVHSPVKYNQIMGRGTRSAGGKENFVIHDCLGAIEHFNEKGYGPFNTTKFEGETQVTGSSGTPTEKREKEYIIVDEEDELIYSRKGFQLESGENKSVEQYKDLVRQVINENYEEISNARLDAHNMYEFNQELRRIFLSEDRGFRTSLIAKAFKLDESKATYIDILDHITYGKNLVNNRTNLVIKSLDSSFKDTKDGETLQKLLKSMDKAVLEEQDLYEEPLSILSYAQIENNLNLPVQEFIKHYNQEHLSIAKRKV